MSCRNPTNGMELPDWDEVVASVQIGHDDGQADNNCIATNDDTDTDNIQHLQNTWIEPGGEEFKGGQYEHNSSISQLAFAGGIGDFDSHVDFDTLPRTTLKTPGDVDPINFCAGAPSAAHGSVIISLREWIKKAVDAAREKEGTRAGTVPFLYLETALKVAISLTEQMIEADTPSGGASQKFGSLTNGPVDWAGHAVVHLSQGANVGENVQDINEQISSFLDSFEKQVAAKRSSSNCPDEQDAMIMKKQSCTANDSCVGSKDEGECKSRSFTPCTGTGAVTNTSQDDYIHNLGEQLEEFLAGPVHDEFVQDTSIENFTNLNEDNKVGDEGGHTFPDAPRLAAASYSVANESSHEYAINFLDIDKAEILPDSNQGDYFIGNNLNSVTWNQRHIFHLGVLFYELFGGEQPPPDLNTLACSNGAFNSLPLTSLMKITNEDHSPRNDNKRRQGSSKSENASVVKVCCEYLKFLGVTNQLCNLIFNMLECVYGDLSGNDCFASISDIKSDLQLMLDRPKLLRGFDTLPTSLQLPETIITREEEFDSIISCYRRGISGSGEIAIIAGESGCGKSWLAQRVGNSITEEGGMFLTAKFDQMKQAQPYSVLASAFDQYCDFLLRATDAGWVQLMVGKLKDALGQESHHLIKLIPKLNLILGGNSRYNNGAVSDVYNHNIGNTAQKIHYLLSAFVEVISSYSKVSITLFLDDVHWIDEASTLFLTRLLSQRYKKFFFMGCYRDDELSKGNHHFLKMLESVQQYVNVTTVQLSDMDEDVLSGIMSDLLRLSPRLIRPLASIVYNKTKGNILFFSQLILALYHDGCLYVDLESQRWMWDEEKIASRELEDNVAICFANSISKLPMEAQLALHTLSMFGASIKSQHIQRLESQFNVNITNQLNFSIARGLVSKVGDSFRFTHDRIQEASYNIIREADRRFNHLTYGRSLAKLALEIGDDDLLLIGVNQINLGGPSTVINRDESFTMSHYNMKAGQICMEMGDFSSSFSFFDHGISFLATGHWSDKYQHSLEIFQLALKSCLASGNIQGFHFLSTQILGNARCFEDTLDTQYLIVSSLVYAGKNAEALEKGLHIVSRLGENIPPKPSQQALDELLSNTKALLRGVTEDDILNYPLMTDANTRVKMKFMARLELIAFFINPTLHYYLVLKMVHMTIRHGLSPTSPIGFVGFGSLLAKLGSIQLGSRFTQAAKALLKKLDEKETAGEVWFMVAEVACFVEPLGAATELHVEGELASLSVGDFHFACWNRMMASINSFWSGLYLPTTNEKLSEAISFMDKQQHKSSIAFTKTVQRSVLVLMGNESESLTGNAAWASIQQSMPPRQLMHLAFHNIFISYMLHSNDLKDCCEKFIDLNSKTSRVFLMYTDSVKTFIIGLAAFRVYRETHVMQWADIGRRSKEDMRIWAEQGCSWNFMHQLLLLEAEESFTHGNFQVAKELFTKAITCAKSHNFSNDEALACELAARFFYDIGDMTSALEYFRLAHEKYAQWGANGKAALLFACIREKLSTLLGGAVVSA